MNRVKILLILIVFLGAVLRLYQLGKTPISLEWDEVAIGYDAYSILKTGRDQFGKFLPNNFRSLDDYKPPLYEYATVPAVAIFGLTEFAVRVPSAFFGIIAVVLTYFLVLEIFPEKKRKERYLIALLSAFFLGISPWHLQFSRAAFETNLSVTVTLAAVILFLKGISGRPKMFILSAVFFGLALFSYHSTRVVTPLLLLSLFLLFHKRLPAKKIILSFLFIYGIFLYFFLPIATSKEAQIRFFVTNDLQSEKFQSESARNILQDSQIGAELVGKIFHNRRITVINYENFKKVISNYLLHFSPKFLFVEGDAPLHHAPGFGMMYFFDLPLLLLGVIYLLTTCRSRYNLVLPIWLLLAPLPAAVTWQSPHSVRAEIILPTLQIFSSIGLIGLLLFFKKEARSFYLISAVIFVFFLIYGTASYLHQYYFHTNIELSKNWLYGRKEAALFTEGLKQNYDRVLVSLKVDMPYIFWLFYIKYPPSKYLSEGGTVSGGFADERNKFDKYEFRNFDYSNLPTDKKLLLVGVPRDFPPDAKFLKTIYYLDGTEALKIAENRF